MSDFKSPKPSMQMYAVLYSIGTPVYTVFVVVKALSADGALLYVQNQIAQEDKNARVVACFTQNELQSVVDVFNQNPL